MKKEIIDYCKRYLFMITIIFSSLCVLIYRLAKNKKDEEKNNSSLLLLNNEAEEENFVLIDKIAWQILANFFAKCGDNWAEKERSDGDFEWKDVVAEFWLELRDKNPKLKNNEVIEEEVNQKVQLILHDIKEGREKTK